MSTMKQNYLKMMACTTFMGILMAGCSNENEPATGGIETGETGISISHITAGMPQGGPNTRLIYEDAANGGLSVKWNADSQNPESFYAICYPADNNTSNYGYGVKFIQEVGASEQASTSTAFKSQRWQDAGFADGSFNGAIQAIYPAKDDYIDGFKVKDISENKSFIQATLPLTGQTGKRADIAKFDYMTTTGTVATDETGDASLDLKFKRRIAVMRIKGLTFPAGVNGDVTEIKLSGNNLANIISVNFMKSSFGVYNGGAGSITTTGTFTIGAGQKLTEDIYICFLPMNADATGTAEITGLTVSAKVGGITYEYNYGEDATVATKVTKFVEGNMYTLTDKVMATAPTFENETTATGASESDAYLIKGYDQLKLFAKRVNGAEKADWNTKYYKLAENIAMPDDGTWTPVDQFSGNFDGNEKTISGLKDVLFKYIAVSSPATVFVKNLNVVCDINKPNDYNIGGIAGKLFNATIQNCNVSGSIKGSGALGGIAGSLNSYTCRIENCHNSASIEGSANGIAGILGSSASSSSTQVTIIACSNSGNITNTQNGIAATAGILAGKPGSANNSIVGCFNSGQITVPGKGAMGIGAFSKGSITACYNSGTISYTEKSIYNGPITSLSSSNTTYTACYYLSSCITGTAGTDFDKTGTAVSAIDYAALNTAWGSDTYQFNTTTGAIEKKNP